MTTVSQNINYRSHFCNKDIIPGYAMIFLINSQIAERKNSLNIGDISDIDISVQFVGALQLSDLWKRDEKELNALQFFTCKIIERTTGFLKRYFWRKTCTRLQPTLIECHDTIFPHRTKVVDCFFSVCFSFSGKVVTLYVRANMSV